MKVCQSCGIEISTRDGENSCSKCEALSAAGVKRLSRKRVKKEREDVLESVGLIKVKGALGGVYWE